MTLKLTTFPSVSVEQYDKLYMLATCTMYTVLAIDKVDELTVSATLNDGVSVTLSKVIHPENHIVLIKEV